MDLIRAIGSWLGGHRRAAIISGAAVVIGAGALVTVRLTDIAHATLSQRTGPPAHLTTTPTTPTFSSANVFQDTSTGNLFSIQLQGGRPDSGSYDYAVKGSGDYMGTAILAVGGSSGNIGVSASGSASFVPVDGSTLSSVPIQLVGQVLKNGTALVLEIWINGVHTHFATGDASAAQGSTVAQTAVTALASHNWASLWTLLSPEAQGHFATEATFAAAVGAQDGSVSSATLTGSPTVTVQGGTAYFSQAVTLTLATPTGPARYATTVYLVFESGGWRVLGTDPPTPG